MIATFPDAASARFATRELGGSLAPTSRPSGSLEVWFIWRIVVAIVLWSVLGGAIGAALGAGIAALVTSGTEGFVIQVVSWMIFGHLIAGMWAGYVLLADRTGEDLPAVRQEAAVLVVVECANIDDTERLEARLRDLGATSVEVTAG